jgi:outer membrane immunogenic protein
MLASARARLGYAFSPNWLAYGTAGAGWGHSTLDASPAGVIGAPGADQFGWVAGAGVEYKFAGHWVARAEYLHYDFGKETFSGFLAVPSTATMSETVDLVRGGISYKF